MMEQSHSPAGKAAKGSGYRAGGTGGERVDAGLAASAFHDAFLGAQACAVSCRADGGVTGMVGDDLLGLYTNSPVDAANVFLDCAVFVGMEDDMAEVITLGGQITLPSVMIDLSGDDIALDVRVVRRNRNEFMVLATRIDLDAQVHFRHLRAARADRYSSQLAELERARFQQFYRSNPVIAFAVDSSGHLLGASDEAVMFACGTMQGDITSWARDMLAIQAPGAGDAGNRLVRDRSHELTSAVRHDGAIRIVDLSVHSLSNPVHGGVEHYFALRDVTRQEVALRILMRRGVERDALAEKLAVSNARLEGFARLAAHDIVAPIGRMAQFSQLLDLRLRTTLEDDEALFYLEAIMDSAKVCTSVVRDILTLAKLDALDAEIEPCDLSRLVREVAASVVPEIGESLNDHLVTECRWPLVLADRRLLSLILRNVFGNAWKYRSPERELSVNLRLERSPGNKATLFIVDNGVGFETNGKSPFDPFARMSSACQAAGTGLGLTAVRSAADALDWTVDIYSEPGQGTALVLSGIGLV